jgi:hypothetical protein
MKQTKVTTAEYIRNNPTATAREVADALSVSISYIYALRRKIKEGKRKVTVTKNQVEIAKKLGVPLEDYVKEGLKHGILKYDENNTDVDAVLDARAKDYGKFIEGAEIMQMLKRLVHNYIAIRSTPLAFDQREAIDMIIHKLGRIINGNPDKSDHWVDISGYAKLVADRLEGNAR